MDTVGLSSQFTSYCLFAIDFGWGYQYVLDVCEYLVFFCAYRISMNNVYNADQIDKEMLELC